MEKIMTAMVALVLLAGCHGLLVNSKTDRLTPLGKAVAWTGWDRVGMAEAANCPAENRP